MFNLKNVVNFFIVYESDSWPSDLNTDFTLVCYLFGGVRLTKNPDSDKYSYIGCGIGLDTHIHHSLPDDSVGKIVLMFGVDMSSSVHIDNKGNIS